MTALSLTPATLDLTVYIGDLKSFYVYVLADGVPVDLTGAVVKSQARHLDTDAAIAFTIGVGPTTVPGQILVSFNSQGEMRATLGGVSQWSGVWDLQFDTTGGLSPITILRGSIRLLNDVSR